MENTVRIGNRELSAAEVLALVRRYQLFPQLLRGILVDEATADYACTEDERRQVLTQFYQQNRIDKEADRQAWLAASGTTAAELEDWILRPLLLEKFKQEKFGPKVETLFLNRKSSLDKVLYSLIRVKDPGVAQELYFRVKEGEEPFSEVARKYSQGAEANTGGLIGPAPLTMPHPAIARALQVSQPGQVWPPTRLDEWYVILRLERFFPAQLDDTTRRQLIDELFETWLKEQMQRAMQEPVGGRTV
ncbi:MAG TPA: peptidylprolyl isomerase [Cyanobacteria bacterium UBA8156]|jgi:parvulin-like peptidyl-prolyl isomerase|nr:peptidylprolyl isomerase [Cyanobacteria bacterium UBA8156]